MKNNASDYVWRMTQFLSFLRLR